MAKTTVVNLVDDIDGGAATETVAFGIDGATYEIDLSTRNATKLRGLLGPYVEHGTRVRTDRATPRRRTTTASPADNQVIRAWAVRKGLDVAPRGRLSREVRDAYAAAGSR